MHLNSSSWWLIFILNFLGYFIFRFGSSKNGKLSPVVEFIGGSLLITSFFFMGFIFGLIEVVFLIIIFMLPITLINEALFFRGKLVKRQEDSVQNDREILEEVMPSIIKRDKSFKTWLDNEIKSHSTK
jgi:hypothetical protein